MDVKSDVSGVMNDVVSWRRHLHENPEIGFDLPNTLEYVSEQLSAMGVEHTVNHEHSYIIGWINKDKPGKTVALRADMDALPVKEESGEPFSSKFDGRMHACGHDSHTAMLLGTTKVLNSYRDQLNGRVKLIFQPAEELGTGSKVLCDDGVMSDVDEIIGLHGGNISEEAKPGDMVFSTGPMMATMDKFTIEIKGRGAHGSAPQVSIDPVTAAAYIITGLQEIISREKDPRNPAVITIGKKLLWCGIFRQEAGNLTTDLCRSINRQSLTIFVLCDKSSIPALLQHNILKKIGSAVDCRLDLSAAITVHKLQDV